jgi:hypothetical protein
VEHLLPESHEGYGKHTAGFKMIVEMLHGLQWQTRFSSNCIELDGFENGLSFAWQLQLGHTLDVKIWLETFALGVLFAKRDHFGRIINAINIHALRKKIRINALLHNRYPVRVRRIS